MQYLPVKKEVIVRAIVLQHRAHLVGISKAIANARTPLADEERRTHDQADVDHFAIAEDAFANLQLMLWLPLRLMSQKSAWKETRVVMATVQLWDPGMAMWSKLLRGMM
jgi:phage tail protein X